MSKGSSTKGFLAGALIGAVAGAVGGLLLAPEKGEQTRKKLKNKIDDLGNVAQDMLESAQERKEQLSKEVNRGLYKIKSEISGSTENGEENIQSRSRKRRYFKGT